MINDSQAFAKGVGILRDQGHESGLGSGLAANCQILGKKIMAVVVVLETFGFNPSPLTRPVTGKCCYSQY